LPKGSRTGYILASKEVGEVAPTFFMDAVAVGVSFALLAVTASLF
jgi:hypothetical protein